MRLPHDPCSTEEMTLRTRISMPMRCRNTVLEGTFITSGSYNQDVSYGWPINESQGLTKKTQMYRKCEKGLVHCLLPILARDGLGRSKEAIIFFFFFSFIWKPEKEGDTERTRSSPLLAHSSNGPYGWARSQPGAKSSILVSHMGHSGPNTWTNFHYSPRCLSRELVLKQSNGDSKCSSSGQ